MHGALVEHLGLDLKISKLAKYEQPRYEQPWLFISYQPMDFHSVQAQIALE